MDIAKFKKQPLMGILRGVQANIIESLVECVIDAGLKTLEITMNTKDAPKIIKRAVRISNNRLTLGAGTVLSVKDLEIALEAGATFIVTPVLIRDVMTHCARYKIPVFPGALTPSEIYEAWGRGATMVKVFPAKFFGPEYFKEIKGPFNDIELLACSGVTPENLKDYFANGASAASFGASVFRLEWLEKKDFASISAATKKFVGSLLKERK